MNFYSARLLLVILVEDERPRKIHIWDEVVIVFRAENFKHAFQRALEIGRSHETEYLNCDGDKVRWALVKIEALDLVGRKIDGQEVASRLHRHRSPEPIPFDKVFHPEDSEPSPSF